MAFNGSGVFLRLYSWVNDAAANIKIRADRMDNEMNGMATGLSTCITKDGQTTITANLPMAGYRHTNTGAGTARTDYARLDQLQDGKINWADGGGTADAITATYSPTVTALVDGQICYVRATAANATTTPTFSPDSLTARTIVKNGGQALLAGDIFGDNHELILKYNLANTRWELLNPYFDGIANGSVGFNQVNKTIISGQTSATIASGDSVLFGDVSDTDNLKKGTVADILSLVPSATVIRNHIDGYIMSTAGASATMTISDGQASDSTNAVYISLASSINKTTSAWAVGSGNGGIDTGSIANTTWYHFYAIRRPDTGVVDVIFSTSASAPTLPANYTQYRRIGAGKTNGSAQWVKFVQNGDVFNLDATVLDINDGATGTSAKTGTLASVPTGVIVTALLQAVIVSNGIYVHFSPLSVSDEAPSTSAAPLAFLGTGTGANTSGNNTVITDASAQFRYRTSGNDTLRIATLGWIDVRGKQ